MKLVPKHVVAARGLLGMTQAQLATAAGITEVALNKFERGKTTPHQSTLEALQTALERRGIEFTNGDGVGVRMDNAKAAEFARGFALERNEPDR